MLVLTLLQLSSQGYSLSAACQTWSPLHYLQAAAGCHHDPSCFASDVHLQVRPQWAAGLPTRGEISHSFISCRSDHKPHGAVFLLSLQ